jgi:hypothetical protein
LPVDKKQAVKQGGNQTGGVIMGEWHAVCTVLRCLAGTRATSRCTAQQHSTTPHVQLTSGHTCCAPGVSGRLSGCLSPASAALPACCGEAPGVVAGWPDAASLALRLQQEMTHTAPSLGHELVTTNHIAAGQQQELLTSPHEYSTQLTGERPSPHEYKSLVRLMHAHTHTHLGLTLLAGSAKSLPDTLRTLPSSTTLCRVPPARSAAGTMYMMLRAHMDVSAALAAHGHMAASGARHV